MSSTDIRSSKPAADAATVPLDWSPLSWQNFPVRQLPDYPDQQALESAFADLKKLPPLVNSWEIDALKAKLAKASRGEMFLLQGGDCAETFEHCNSSHIVKLLKVLLQMSFIMVHEMNIGVIRLGRIAGQYAKPRSKPTERVDDIDYPIYRGDLVNGYEADAELRKPSAQRLVEAYHKSGLTLNFIRSLTEGGGFADLHHPEYWELNFMKNNKFYDEYAKMVSSITNAIRFMEGILPTELVNLRQVEMFTSHEALNLYYDSAQTRRSPHKDGWYNMSTHLPWIGNRTRDPKEAHVEYFRGLKNPIGIKVGPPYDIDEIADLVQLLNPSNEEGKITLITRFGSKIVETELPKLIDKIEGRGLKVLWSADPMHGNTFATESGIKTRAFDDIMDEIRKSFAVHRQMGSILGGVHLEMTGEDVTECVGGANGLNAQGLSTNYQSYCDPRLNYEQSLELAFMISREWKASQKKK
ncbi:MAG: 3-deoxy-7-phosphoheptulonate synthase [Balneolales bacterium]|nr:3-deoxy-7-phosphoheptulonate synthase [Balneolales bacterium]